MEHTKHTKHKSQSIARIHITHFMQLTTSGHKGDSRDAIPAGAAQLRRHKSIYLAQHLTLFSLNADKSAYKLTPYTDPFSPEPHIYLIWFVALSKMRPRNSACFYRSPPVSTYLIQLRWYINQSGCAEHIFLLFSTGSYYLIQ